MQLTTKNILSRLSQSHWTPGILIAIAISLLYGQFLWNPVVFDDLYFFNGSIRPDYLGKIFSFNLRWLPYATFEWTREILGLDLIWFRLGNMLLHITNSILLFLFLRSLFGVVLIIDTGKDPSHTSSARLSPTWTAFFAALIFSLHPVSVYAVAYLVQRSTVMATFFVLLMLMLFLQGLIRGKSKYFIASAIAYFFAVLSKEHAIMAPALTVALLFLICKPTKQLVRQILPTFILYGITAIFVFYQVKSSNILGHAYEINASDMLSRLSRYSEFDTALAYPLSILTQSWLFFKYIGLWLVPSTASMSVDMVENFATRLSSWSYMLSFAGFILYVAAAVYLLLQRGSKGLLGFAMLCPGLMFATEFSTVRIQESFVLYRSYLWMVCAFAVIPFLLQKLSAKRAVWFLTFISLLMVPLSWGRLMTFSHPLLLWDDAARLVTDKEMRPGVERIYHNRGIEYAQLKMYPEAIQDYEKAISIYPEYSYAFNDRGASFFETGRYSEALKDFERASELNPRYSRPYLGLARTYEALGNQDASRKNYEELCTRGINVGCEKK